MNEYPVKFAVDYPERELSRLTSFFRIFTVIPIAIVFSAITGYSNTYGGVDGTTVTVVVSGVGVLFLPVLLLILFRKKYPRWWFDWNLQLQSFANRIGVYALLMDDRYPSTDEEQGVHLHYPYPDVERDLGRGIAADERHAARLHPGGDGGVEPGGVAADRPGPDLVAPRPSAGPDEHYISRFDLNARLLLPRG